MNKRRQGRKKQANKVTTGRKFMGRSQKRPVTPKEDPNDHIDEDQKNYMRYISESLPIES